MIKYLIIDDEHVAHDIIKDYCDMLPNMELQKHCYDALEASQYLQNNNVDLIFLDLNMPKLRGFDFLKTLSSPPKVIVTTAYSEFALEGYELNVVDYLLKPFSFERFLKAVNKAMASVAPNQNSDAVSKSNDEQRIFIKNDKKYTQIKIIDIMVLEASGNYCKISTPKETITTREKLSTLMEMLPSTEFVQVHKSFAVAPQHINSIEGNRITVGEQIVPVGKLYKLNVSRLLPS